MPDVVHMVVPSHEALVAQVVPGRGGPGPDMGNQNKAEGVLAGPGGNGTEVGDRDGRQLLNRVGSQGHVHAGAVVQHVGCRMGKLGEIVGVHRCCRANVKLTGLKSAVDRSEK